MNPSKTAKIFNKLLLLAVIFALAVQLIAAPVSAENDRSALNGDDAARETEQGGAEAESEDYRRWAQGDPRWGSIRLGSHGRTVAEVGCLVTAVTKLIIQSGYRHQDEFNVATLVNWLNANGGLSSEGNLYWYKPAEMIEGLEFDGMDFNCGSSSSSAVQNKIMEHVRANRHVVLTVKNYGHYVAVDNAKSLAEGQVYIMDSLNNTATNADIPLTSRYATVSRICIYSGNNAQDSDYISRCSFTMTHLYARCVSAYACYYTLPCTVNAGEGSEAVGTIGSGSLVEVTADIVNTFNQRWYQIMTADGQQLYIWGPQLTFERFINDIEVVSLAPPTGTLTNGRGFPLTENIVSRHRIASITGRITDADANVLCEKQVFPGVHGGFDISDTELDAGLTFGVLPVGAYSYELITEVECSSSITGGTTVFSYVFTSPFSSGAAPLPTHTVTFIDAFDGSVLQTQTIADGFYPVLFTPPTHDGYTFVRWENGSERVYGDVNVSAIFAPPFIPGDADGNGVVNVSDALTIMRYALDNDLPGVVAEAADYNGDGEVTATDALLLLRDVMA